MPILASLASAILLVLALPPAGLHYLAWLCLVPALYVSHGRGFWRGFGIGLMVVAFAAVVSRSGIFYHPSLLNGDAGWNYAGFGIFGVAVGLTLGVWAQSRSISASRLWILAASSIVFEALLLVYLPAHLALTQSRVPAMLALASVTGIWGVSYLLWLSNLAIAWALREGKLRSLLIPGGILILAATAGQLFWRPGEGDVEVAAIQTSALDQATFQRLNAEAGKQGAKLAVWPEGSADKFALTGDTTKLRELAASPGQPPFVAGFEDSHQPLPYNCATLLTPTGESIRYAKRRPFGSERRAHTPGDHPVSTPFLGHQLGFGICFDSCYPATLREAANMPGVALIALPTKDPRAPYGTVQSLHAAYTAFRAAENGVPLIRADTSAYSQIIDGHGFVVAEGGSGTEEVVTAKVSLGRHSTIYSIAGDWILYLCAALCLAALFVSREANALRQTD